MTLNSSVIAELRRRLCKLREQRLEDEPALPAMRIGIEDEAGELVDVVETSRIVNAVRVFELLGELGFERCSAHRSAGKGHRLTCVYAQVRSRL
jgi:hypothetical protein